MLRRVKESPEVGLSIPQKTETVLSVPLSEFQRSLYLRILTGIENSILGGHGGISFEQKRLMATDQQSEKRKYRILSNILMELRKVSHKMSLGLPVQTNS